MTFSQKCFAAFDHWRKTNDSVLTREQSGVIIDDLFSEEISSLRASKGGEPKRYSGTYMTAAGKASDADFIDWLKHDPAYQGLDIDRELNKAQAWASVNGKAVTRRRFVNWLLKADRPISAQNGNRASMSLAPSLPEPLNWQRWALENLPGCIFLHEPWVKVPPHAQKVIYEGMKAHAPARREEKNETHENP